MSYKPIPLSQNTPDIVKKFIHNNVDILFNDVHCMLRLPIKEIGLEGTMAFSAINCLSDIVSGISALLTPDFDTIGDSGPKFKEILKDYYPWDLQPPIGGSIDRAVKDMYDYFRNPLTHSLGLKTKGNYLVAIEKKEISELDLETLEKNIFSPGPAISYSPITIKNENIEKITLDVAPFYWGVRQILVRLSANSTQMQDTAKNLLSHGYQ